MKTLSLLLLVAAVTPATVRAQAAPEGPQAAPGVAEPGVVVSSTSEGRLESARPDGWMPARVGPVQEATGMDRVQELRAAGHGFMKQGKYREAAEAFREALTVLEGLPTPKASHATIGFYGDYVIFLPGLNF